MKKPTPLYKKKNLRAVTTRDYIEPMKTQVASELEETTSSVVQEIAPLPGGGAGISVRAAKAHLSGLLDQVVVFFFSAKVIVRTGPHRSHASTTPNKSTVPRCVVVGSNVGKL